MLQRPAFLNYCLPESGLTFCNLFSISVYISVYGLLCLDTRPTSREAGVVYNDLLWGCNCILMATKGCLKLSCQSLYHAERSASQAHAVSVCKHGGTFPGLFLHPAGVVLSHEAFSFTDRSSETCMFTMSLKVGCCKLHRCWLHWYCPDIGNMVNDTTCHNDD